MARHTLPLFRTFLLLGALGAVSSSPAATDSGPPNIVIILADDLGYSDVGCFGGEMDTPSIDRLASQGLRLTHFYNGGMCVVSRSCLLTGQWWPKAGRQFTQLPLLSEQLKGAGYRTALIGKWHLKGDPMDRGFDHFFGMLNGFADHFSGGPHFRLDREPFDDFGDDWYSSDAFSERAIQFIRAAAESPEKEPFFLYLSYQAPHNPLQAPESDILRKRGKYLDGWQAVRESRFLKQKKLGLIDSDSSLPDYPKNLPRWKSLSPAQQDLEDLRMATYAAMVERMDTGIGRVLRTLEDLGEAENTLVLFMSDNGTDSFSVLDEPLIKRGMLPGDAGSNWQPGTGWAYASVTPWRLYKISQHAGGVTSGAIACWPGQTGKPGRITGGKIHVVDIMPTILEITGASRDGSTFAGESFLPLLAGHPWTRRSPMYFQKTDNRAIRTGEWTLAEVDDSGWELFHPASDPFENSDLADSKPELVADLSAKWSRWWRDQSGMDIYTPESTNGSRDYKAQGDRGTGVPYHPTPMPSKLADRYPLPPSSAK